MHWYDQAKEKHIFKRILVTHQIDYCTNGCFTLILILLFVVFLWTLLANGLTGRQAHKQIDDGVKLPF